MNDVNPYVRLLIFIVAIAVAIHVAWVLVEPALPFLMVVVALAVVLVAVRWWRDRL